METEEENTFDHRTSNETSADEMEKKHVKMLV
jgi:hypothetical protein